MATPAGPQSAPCTHRGHPPPLESRTGTGAPAGIGTVTPDNTQVVQNASYLALEAYKFDLPNTENFLPASTCAMSATLTRSLASTL